MPGSCNISFETIPGLVWRQLIAKVCNLAETRGRQLISLYTRLGSTDDDKNFKASSSRYPATYYPVS